MSYLINRFSISFEIFYVSLLLYIPCQYCLFFITSFFSCSTLGVGHKTTYASRADLLYHLAKKVPDQLSTGLWNKGPQKFPYDYYLITNESTRINLVPIRTFRGPLLHKPVPGQVLFLPLVMTNRL